MPTTEDFISAATALAPAFGLEPRGVTLLSRSENVVCEIDLGRERAVMRFHRPGYNSLAELRSEIAFVGSLADAGIPVSRARPTIGDGYYVEADVAGIVHHVGVVAWVEGAPLGSPVHAGDANVVEQYTQIGVLAAQIRNHSLTWQPPAGFVRRRWDAEHLVGEAPLWGRFWEVSTLSDDQRLLFTEARHELQKVLGSLSTEPDRFGLIHADLHLGNVMANGGHLTVIDFDDAGYGWFVHELAVALHPVVEEPFFPEARRAMIEGYRSVHSIESAEENLIDTFITIRYLMLIGWFDDRRDLPNYSYFPTLVAGAEKAARQFLHA